MADTNQKRHNNVTTVIARITCVFIPVCAFPDKTVNTFLIK